MKLIVTKDVANHQFNPKYPCLVIQWELDDTNYMPTRKNWMPRDDELMEINKKLLDLSPTFREKMLKWIKQLNFQYSDILGEKKFKEYEQQRFV